MYIFSLRLIYFSYLSKSYLNLAQSVIHHYSRSTNNIEWNSTWFIFCRAGILEFFFQSFVLKLLIRWNEKWFSSELPNKRQSFQKIILSNATFEFQFKWVIQMLVCNIWYEHNLCAYIVSRSLACMRIIPKRTMFF